MHMLGTLQEKNRRQFSCHVMSWVFVPIISDGQKVLWLLWRFMCYLVF